MNFSWVASLEIYPGGFLYSECLANHLSKKWNSIFITVKLNFFPYVATCTSYTQTHTQTNIDNPQNHIQAIWCNEIIYEISAKFGPKKLQHFLSWLNLVILNNVFDDKKIKTLRFLRICGIEVKYIKKQCRFWLPGHFDISMAFEISMIMISKFNGS